MNCSISRKTGTIGSAHDPYSTEEVVIKFEGGHGARFYTDALGSNRLTLWSSDGVDIRKVSYFDGNWQMKLKVRLLFKHHTGRDLRQVQYEAEEMAEFDHKASHIWYVSPETSTQWSHTS